MTDAGRFTVEMADLNDPRKIKLRSLEKDVKAERQQLIIKVLSALERLEGDGTLLDEDRLALDRASLRNLTEKLIDTHARFPEPIDLTLDSRKPLFTFDCLKAERELTPFIVSYLKSRPEDMARLDPSVFEQLVAEFFASWGYEVKLLGRNPRTGADIMALKTEQPVGVELRYLIEVKRERRRIGIEEIHRTLGVLFFEKQRYAWDVAFLFSASGFKDFRKTSADELRRSGLVLKSDVDIKEYLRGYQPRVDGGLWLPDGWHMGEVG